MDIDIVESDSSEQSGIKTILTSLALLLLCGLIAALSKKLLPEGTELYTTTGQPTGILWATVAVIIIASTAFAILRLTKTNGLIGMFLQIMSIALVFIATAGIIIPHLT